MKRKIGLASALALTLSSALAQVPLPIGPVNGGGGGSGGVPSISTTCPASGPTTTAVTLGQPNGRKVTAATDSIAAGDCGSVIEYSGVTAKSVSLPSAATLYAASSNKQWCVNLSNDTGAGTVTVTSAGGNFNTTGSTTLTIAAGLGPTICTDSAGAAFVVGTGMGGGGVSGPGSSTNGDLPSFNGTAGNALQDSGVAAANVATGPGSATSGDLPSFNGTGGKALQDSGVPSANVVQGPGSAVNNNCAKFGSTTGKLIADSGVACGGGYQMVAAYKSSNWYRSIGSSNVAAGNTAAANTVTCHPFVVSSQGLTVKGIGAVVQTLGTGNVSFAIYKADGTSGRPGTLIDTISAAQSTGATGAVNGTLTNTTDSLSSGMNWVCASYDNTTVRFYTPATNGSDPYTMFVGSSALANIIGNVTQTVGLQCAVASCGGSFAAWSGSTFNWYSLSSATWTETTGGLIPEIALQAN